MLSMRELYLDYVRVPTNPEEPYSDRMEPVFLNTKEKTHHILFFISVVMKR